MLADIRFVYANKKALTKKTIILIKHTFDGFIQIFNSYEQTMRSRIYDERIERANHHHHHHQPYSYININAGE